ncbi:MAG TPA: hypothetical protein VFC50_02575 [Candidatus Dormibacteraeota bacterium]|nr:hypothetical protein [Candidatus Dormibacteraeota bacterium]
MSEFTDGDGIAYSKMPAELFAVYPGSFVDYGLANPAILPDYGPYARQAFDLITRRPDELIMLEGTHGIGKTTQLIPELLKTGQQHGYQDLGSISVINWEGGLVIYLDGHQRMLQAANNFDLHPSVDDRFHLPERDDQMSEVSEELRNRFESATTPGLFIFDEAVGAAEDLPAFTRRVLDEARGNGVTVAITQPVRLWEGHQMDYRLDIERLEMLVDRKVTAAAINEVTVLQAKIPGLLTALGVELSLVDDFEQNPNLRRLRVVEYIANQIIIQRKRHNEDDFIWDREYITSIVDLLDISNEHEENRRLGSSRRWNRLGLSPDQVRAIRLQFSTARG